MLLLFRAADRYELFDEDATVAAPLLGLELRVAPGPFSWFPAEALEAHLRTLLRAGHRIAICESEDTV